MKPYVVLSTAFLLSFSYSTPAFPAPNTGQAANDALGQFTSPSLDTTASYSKNCENNGASSIGFDFSPTSYPDEDLVGFGGSAIDSTNHWLFVPDFGNNRVLVFSLTTGNLLSSKTPSYVLGQPDFVSCGCSATQSTMCGPTQVAVDPSGKRLFVPDMLNNRVLVFSTTSMSNGMNASYVLGQSNFTADAAATTQASMNLPMGLAYDSANGRLFVAETKASNFFGGGNGLYSDNQNYARGSNRILVFNVASGTIANGENASYVLGQANFTSSGAAASQSGVNGPFALAYDSSNTRLFVADTFNNRVLVFNVATGTITNGENAANVLGQSSFTAKSAHITRAGMDGPDGLAYDSANTRLFVADSNNNRVTVYNVATGSITNGENASNVLGQSSFTTAAAGTSQSALWNPGGIAYESVNNQLYVDDLFNNREIIFSTSSITNGENASDLLGQYTSTSSAATVSWTQSGPNNGPTALGMFGPQGMALDTVNHRFFIADSSNNRVLVYNLNTDNSFPTSSGGHTAPNVLGQPNFSSTDYNTTQSGMYSPIGLAFDSVNNRLFVDDETNERVLVFNTATITNGMNASYVLGQADFVSGGRNTTQSGLADPQDIAYDSMNTRLFVADTGNNRVLVFNVAPATIANGENASNVLGQSTYTGSTCATSQSVMLDPDGLAYDAVNSRLFVAESSNAECGGNSYSGNNRILVFNVATSTITNGENASNVLGQPNFTSSAANTTQSNLYGPAGLSYDYYNQRLFVADYGNGRVLMFNAAPGTITNGENAMIVLGQSNFTTNANSIGTTWDDSVTQSGLFYCNNALYDPGSGRLFVSDTWNNRILIFNASFMPSGDWYLP